MDQGNSFTSKYKAFYFSALVLTTEVDIMKTTHIIYCTIWFALDTLSAYEKVNKSIITQLLLAEIKLI